MNAPASRANRHGVARTPAILADVGAAAILLASTVHLVAQNGGRDPRDMFAVLIVCALGVLPLIPSLRRTSPRLAWLIAAWSLAPLVALLLAEVRAGAVRPLAAAALGPPVVIATIHLWRRRWGPAAIGSILALAAARSWFLTFLAWWGGALGRPTWLALSWHNQSGTLMGALGVAGAATAAVRGGRPAGRKERVAAVVAGALGAACLAGAWLSGSRGAVVATGLGLVAVGVGLARGGALRRGGPVLAVVVVAAALVVGGLEGMVQSDSGQPLASRDQTASGNLTSRFGYWEAAVGMALSRPLTGWGPGSYRWASVPHYPEDTNLTSSAHNEYLEVLGESGLVGSIPVWLAALAVAVLAGSTLLDRRGPSVPRQAGAVAAAVTALVLGLHAGLDFDWDYPLLLALLAVSAGILWAHQAESATISHPEPRVGATAALAAATGTLVLLAVAVAAATVTRQGEQPWDLGRALGSAVAAVETGDLADVAGATARLATADRWNPGAPPIPVLTALLGHTAGTVSDSTLLAMVDPRTTPHPLQILTARRLRASGAGNEALEVIQALEPVLLARARWGVTAQALDAAALKLRLRAELDGCAAAATRVEPARRWLQEFQVEPEAVDTALAEVERETGCELPGT